MVPNPSELLRQRDQLIERLARWPQVVAEFSLPPADRIPAEQLDTLGAYAAQMVRQCHRQLSVAQIIAWRSDLWQAATRGASAFQDTPLGTDDCGIPPQLWLMEPESAVALASPKLATGWQLDRPCSFEGLLVFPANVDGHLGLAAVLIFQPAKDDYQEGVPESFVPRIRTLTGLAAGQHIHSSYANVLAGLRFLAMEFVGQERQILPRQTRRAAELQRRPPLPEINVVQLRRVQRNEKTHRADGEERDYQCQWLVSGHWRKQWYPSAAERRPKYIAPHVKGPEGKPLRKPKGTIYVVKR